jgi:hypothetical protein
VNVGEVIAVSGREPGTSYLFMIDGRETAYWDGWWRST